MQRKRGIIRSAHVVLLALVVSTLYLLNPTVTGQTVASTELTLADDGNVHVKQTFILDELDPSIAIVLLSQTVTNLLSLDEKNQPLSYDLSGQTLTAYTLGATKLVLSYDTSSLTALQSGTWTLTFTTSANTTILFPQKSKLLYISGNPLDSNLNLQNPLIVVAPGQWQLSYSLQLTSGAQNGSKSRCIITTAAFGSELAPQVQILRGFRDGIVKSSLLGRSFTAGFEEWYYSWSPEAAEMITQNSHVRSAVKVGVVPLLWTLSLTGELNGFTENGRDIILVASGLFASLILGAIYSDRF